MTMMKAEYLASDKLLREEFITTGHTGPITRYFRFDPEKLTPKQRTILTWAMPLDLIRSSERNVLVLFDYDRRVNPTAIMRLDHEIQDVDELFVHVLEMLAAAARWGEDPTRSR